MHVILQISYKLITNETPTEVPIKMKTFLQLLTSKSLITYTKISEYDTTQISSLSWIDNDVTMTKNVTLDEYITALLFPHVTEII